MTKLSENPVMILLLGSVLALGATTNVLSAAAVGVSACVVMVLTSVLVNAFKSMVDEKGLVVVTVVITAGLASVCDMLVHAFVPGAYNAAGIYLSLVAVNALVLKQSELTYKGTSNASDAFKVGVEFLLCLVAVAAIRELFGYGSFAGVSIPVLCDHTTAAMVKAPGAFVALALVAACVNKKSVKEGE